ncbi:MULTISPECIES: Hsp20/alpha crystallin family protein [Streptomyces]|uniref:Hsp20/alpha crystallin family protein n=1 Tax=Streptomyces edwardsiae TaxID=3075527 RepID=A0ABU2PWV8_9ACTN|nr:Hsp20/alpha crystallin family protein [Streptomyces sp. DSM 41636]MDT0396625.1 Hsp20/alpha crystallin family protein [Streptomyces sp. DSM 41636]
MTLPVHRNRGQVSGWDPFRELEELRTRMDQLMHSTFPFPGSGFAQAEAGAWAPLADVEDTEDAYLMELEVPGVDKDRITVEVGDGELDIHGEIEEKERTGVLRRQARHAGEFGYRTSLPANADTESITAELANGVLTVRVPKAEKAKQHRIEITG